MNRLLRVAFVVTAVFILGTTMLGVNAKAATTHVRTIDYDAFKDFDTTPKAFDIDGDGSKEIIAHNDNRHIYVLDSKTGAIRADLRTTYPSYWGARPLNSPEVATFVEGGKPHVVVANSAAYISVFRYDGQANGKFAFTKVWEHRMDDCFSDPGMDAKPVLADLDGDGRMEILGQTEEKGVYAFRSNGAVYWHKCIWGGNGEPAVGDLDHDGILDVVWASDGGTVTAMDGRGWVKWTFWAKNHANIGAASMPVAPTIGQVDGVGPLDVVVGARDSHDANNYDNNHAALFVIKGNGNLLWVRQHSQGNPLTYTHPIIHDVDNDGVADILWGDWNTIGHKPGNWEVTGPANYYRYDAHGNLRWRTELNTYWSNKDLALADVDGDGVHEVLANGPCGGGDGIWYLNSRTGGKESCFSTHPWKVSRGPVIYDLWSTGTMQLVVPVSAATSSVNGGAIMIFDTHQAYRAPWPHPPGPQSSTGGTGTGGTGGTGSGGDFAASFDPRSQDNEWWVEVKVNANEPLDRVVAIVDGGQQTHQLDKTSWGTYAKSFHAPAGTQIAFRAVSTDGDRDTSQAYTWGGSGGGSGGTGGTGGTGDGTFDANFDPRSQDNEWWVEVKVNANEPLDRVVAIVDGGQQTHQLSKTDWGTYAKSFHAPAGTQIAFRAVSTDGDRDTSQTYTWGGSGGGTGGTADGPFTASFDPRSKGNDWWVEVAVKGSEPIALVEAQRDGGAWTTLPKTDWGTYAKSIHAPDGTQVRFRATSSDGDRVTSTTYTWN